MAISTIVLKVWYLILSIPDLCTLTFNTLAEAVNFMVTAGISVQDIDYIETEGEVIMKKPLLSVKPNIIEEITKIDTKTQIKARSTSPVESQQEQGVQCISIDGSCKKNETVNAVAGFGISGEITQGFTGRNILRLIRINH